MALTTCKECNQEVSTEAKTCPYCGIDNPGVIDNNRRLGVVVLVVMIFLGIFIFTRPEKVDYQYAANAQISENKGTDMVKANQEANSTQSSSEQPRSMEAVAEEASIPSQQSSAQTTPRSPVIQESPKQKVLELLGKTKNISLSDKPQMMVMRMLEYALNDGGLSHESEIQQTKLQIESSPEPEKGNKKEARAINAKGLASSKKGDFNNAVKMFEEASELDKSDIEIINNLGFSYLKQGNLDAAQQAITRVLTMSPGRTTAWENLGEVFGKKGDVNKALACFSNAYRFSKDRLTLHQYMKKRNEKEDDKNLKQARTKAINWAEKSYLNISKNTQPKERVSH
jgi:tetratricopeptide (TPR) repeat protein